jgi:hypothetical protein
MTDKIYWRDFSASLVVLAVGVGFLLWALTYEWSAAEVPILVASMTIILGAIDAISQTKTKLGRIVRRFVASQKIIEWKAEGDEEAATSRINSAIFWILAYVAGVVLIGFVLMTPIYVFLYMKLHGGKSLLASAITAALTAMSIYIAFEIVFKYPLYSGILFGGRI